MWLIQTQAFESIKQKEFPAGALFVLLSAYVIRTLSLREQTAIFRFTNFHIYQTLAKN